MKKLNEVFLEKYSINSEASSEPQEKTYDEPASPGTIYLNIESILVNEKTVLLKDIKKGDKLLFRVNQSVSGSMGEEDFEGSVDVDAYGEVVEVLNFDSSLSDDVEQEVEILLEDASTEGYQYN